MFRHITFAAVAVLSGILLNLPVLIPLLLLFYLLGAASGSYGGWRKLSRVEQENRDLKQAAGGRLSVTGANHRTRVRFRRTRVVFTWLVTLIDRLLIERLYWQVEIHATGRHAHWRMEAGEIHGASAQRRPSAAAGQRAVAAGWDRPTGEEPAITDEDVHRWLAEGAQEVHDARQ